MRVLWLFVICALIKIVFYLKKYPYSSCKAKYKVSEMFLHYSVLDIERGQPGIPPQNSQPFTAKYTDYIYRKKQDNITHFLVNHPGWQDDRIINKFLRLPLPWQFLTKQRRIHQEFDRLAALVKKKTHHKIYNDHPKNISQ